MFGRKGRILLVIITFCGVFLLSYFFKSSLFAEKYRDNGGGDGYQKKYHLIVCYLKKI